MKKRKISLIGCGSIGTGIAVYIDSALQEHARLVAVCDTNSAAAQALCSRLTFQPAVCALDAAIAQSDLVIEAASGAAAKEILKRCVEAGRDMMILSVGALIDAHDMMRRARDAGITLYVPSGAICGVDGFSALAQAKGIRRVTLTSSKPPAGFAGALYLTQRNIHVGGLQQPMVIFRGTVQGAIAAFPQNINVAATLYLATGGADVEVVIAADPALQRNIHRIEVESDQARIRVEVENVPSQANPKTSSLAILSAQACLQKMFATLKIGS